MRLGRGSRSLAITTHRWDLRFKPVASAPMRFLTMCWVFSETSIQVTLDRLLYCQRGQWQLGLDIHFCSLVSS